MTDQPSVETIVERCADLAPEEFERLRQRVEIEGLSVSEVLVRLPILKAEARNG